MASIGDQTMQQPSTENTEEAPSYFSKAPPEKLCARQDDTIFTVRIINTLSYLEKKLAITKRFTIEDIIDSYMAYEQHPEYYLWQDVSGRNLDLSKTVVENGLISEDEIVEFDGIGKEPCILLIYKDGFENEIPETLNPMKNYPRLSPAFGRCKNY